MMHKSIALLAIVAVVRAQNKDADFDLTLSQIFGKPDQADTPLNPVQPTTGFENMNNGQPINPNLGTSNGLPPGVSDVTNDSSCMTEKGEVGECVRYYLCDDNNIAITDGTSIINIRANDGPCPSYLDSCCIVEHKREPDQPLTPKPAIQNDNRPTQGGCGWRNPEGVVMKTTGDVEGEAKFAEFPWVVAILKDEPASAANPDGPIINKYIGGGSLIHPSIVLTAAHVVVANAKKLRVRAGEWDTQTVKEIYPYQDRDVAKIVTHKDFNRGNLFYDVALLFLSKPVDAAPNVGLACLPASFRNSDPPTQGTRCFASGWGKDKFGDEESYQVILKKVDVPVVSNRECQEAMRKTRLGRFFMLHTSFMCAGGEPGIDTCQGDGGSPLVCPMPYEEGRYVQNGIVAWGIGCGENGTPGVYVDVARLREWIDDKVKGEGYDITGYSYTV